MRIAIMPATMKAMPGASIPFAASHKGRNGNCTPLPSIIRA